MLLGDMYYMLSVHLGVSERSQYCPVCFHCRSAINRQSDNSRQVLRYDRDCPG